MAMLQTMITRQTTTIS